MFYGRRQGRAIKPYKQKLIAEKLPQIRLFIKDDHLSCVSSFDQFNEAYLEIGFGDGTHLTHLAKLHSEKLIIGCEPFINGVGSCLAKIEEEKLENVRVYDGMVQEIIPCLDANFFSKIYLLFPDPWPKKRHFKRRIISVENMQIFLSRLKPGGAFIFASDHEGYREWALEIFAQLSGVKILYQGENPPQDWVETYFQQKGLKAGREPYFVVLEKAIF